MSEYFINDDTPLVAALETMAKMPSAFSHIVVGAIAKEAAAHIARLEADVRTRDKMLDECGNRLLANKETIARLEARVAELEEIVQEVAEDGCYETLGVGDGCGQCIACRSRKLLNHPAIPNSSPCHGSGKEGDHA